MNSYTTACFKAENHQKNHVSTERQSSINSSSELQGESSKDERSRVTAKLNLHIAVVKIHGTYRCSFPLLPLEQFLWG